MKHLLVIISVILFTFSLAGCNPGKALTGDAKTEVLAYTEPMADTLLAGLIANDYNEFSKDFDEAMLKGIDDNGFADLKSMLDSKIGGYQSREVTGVAEVDENILIVYNAIFEKAPEVTIRFSVSVAEPHQVTGLWFDSPELRK